MKQIVLLFALIALNGYSQINDSISPDYTSEEQDSIKTHSVKKATIFSAVLPGAGQVYNHIAMPKGKKKAYWKVPLIYAGLGATCYFAIKNNNERNRLKEEFVNRYESGGTYSQEYINYDSLGIVQLYQQKINRRDLFFLGMGLVYLIQIADAAVEAHFVNFDVSEDLTMRIRPKFIPPSIGYSPIIGVSLQLQFK